MTSSLTFSNKYVKDIYNIDKEIDDELNKFPSISYIYKSSIINWEWLFQNISMLSVETANTLSQLEDMSFFKFDKLLYYTNEYLEKKNGNGDNGTAQEEFGNMQQNMSGQMNQMKNSFKVPKMKTPKL